MNPLEVKPVSGTVAPRYPARAEPGGETVRPPMISNGISRFAPLVLFAIAPGVAAGGARRDRQESAESSKSAAKPVEVKRLTDRDVAGLLGELEEKQKREGPVMLGSPAVPTCPTLTEAEVRELLETFFRKNGVATRRDVKAERDGVVIKAAVEAGGALFRLRDETLTEAESDEIAMLKARGEARVLIADPSESTTGWTNLPTRRQIAEKLLAELERFMMESR
jgi:hypothetical protein